MKNNMKTRQQLIKEYIDRQVTKRLNEITKTKLPIWFKQADVMYHEVGINNNQFVWISGSWYDGTWKNGIWHSGQWYDGTWQNGKWLDGEWYDGTWKNGTWCDGSWENGKWKNGVWENGKIYSHQFRQFIDSKVNPNEFYKIEKECKTVEELKEKVSKK